jgi:hypothetical protein
MSWKTRSLTSSSNGSGEPVDLALDVERSIHPLTLLMHGRNQCGATIGIRSDVSEHKEIASRM